MALSACFKDEAPNAECDIEAAFVSVDQATDVFNNLSDTLVAVPSTSTDIVFADLSQSNRFLLVLFTNHSRLIISGVTDIFKQCR